MTALTAMEGCMKEERDTASTLVKRGQNAQKKPELMAGSSRVTGWFVLHQVIRN